MTIKIIKTVDAECIKKANEKFAELHEENQRLREALEHIANGCLVPPDGGSPIWPDDAVRSAREALALTKPATDKEESL